MAKKAQKESAAKCFKIPKAQASVASEGFCVKR